MRLAHRIDRAIARVEALRDRGDAAAGPRSFSEIKRACMDWHARVEAALVEGLPAWARAAYQAPGSDLGWRLRCAVNVLAGCYYCGPVLLPEVVLEAYRDEPTAYWWLDACEDCGYYVPHVPETRESPRRHLFPLCPVCGGRTSRFTDQQSMPIPEIRLRSEVFGGTRA